MNEKKTVHNNKYLKGTSGIYLAEVQDRGRDYRYSRSGGAADNQVRGQSFSQAEDPPYVDIRESTASHHDDHIYTDVTEHHWIQNYNPNYGEVKEQNTTQPAKLQ